MQKRSADRSAGPLRWLGAALTGLLPTPTTPAQINPGLSLWLDEKRGSRQVEELIRRKKETRELGDAPISLTIMQFIDDEFDRWGTVDLYTATTVNETARAAAADFYRDMVVRFSAAPQTRGSPPCANYLP